MNTAWLDGPGCGKTLVSATVQTSPARIVLSWPQDVIIIPNSYTIYRKAPNATSWGTGTVLPGTTTNFTDANVTIGTAYEYQIIKTTSLYIGTGYILAGINAPLTEGRDKLILIVDNTYASNLASELARLQQDLVGDGSNSSCTVRYFTGTSAGSDITLSVTSGSYTVKDLPSQTSVVLRIQVTVKSVASSGTAPIFTILATSLTDPTKSDAVKFTVPVK